ncbi:transcription factor MYBS3-like [Gastrolobium bilobum]|uniref:transcription factor MYBS3-like n=1 Tax=Gastrolobium bilobum TaxID=150636 RepID=UPI002AAFA415|nr:transcription factor MYBS3-like [Gastrolobium bilobum]
METSSQENVEEPNETIIGSNGVTPVPPEFFPTYLPLPFSICPSNAASFEEVNGAETLHHQVFKPIPVILKEPFNVDELVGMSQLRVGETQVRERVPSPLFLKLLGEPSRQSAFHAKTPVGGFDI